MGTIKINYSIVLLKRLHNTTHEFTQGTSRRRGCAVYLER